MRFRDIRPVLLKGIDTPDLTNRATPRWLSPRASGYLIAKGRGVDPPQPEPKLRRRKVHRRLPGVALKSHEMPWKGQE